MTKIVAFTGRAGSGKDTAANYLVSQFGFVKISFADPLRQVGKIVFGLTDAEMTDRVLKEQPLDRYPCLTPRVILQRIGTEAFRNNFPGVWVEAFKREAARYDRVVVADCRFEDEEQAVHELGGSVYRVKGVNSPFQTVSSGHASEQFIDTMNVDADVTNDFGSVHGRSLLCEQIDQLMKPMARASIERRHRAPVTLQTGERVVAVDWAGYGADRCPEAKG